VRSRSRPGLSDRPNVVAHLVRKGHSTRAIHPPIDLQLGASRLTGRVGSDRHGPTVPSPVSDEDLHDHDMIHGAWTAQYGSYPYGWGSVAFFRINPTAMWTYAGKPKEFPKG